MAYEHIKRSTLSGSVSAVLADLADLVQKEIRLARAEISGKLTTKLRAGAWMAAAGLFAFIALLLIVQALVFAIASFGIALYWACLIVAAVMGLAGAIAYSAGRADAKEDLYPTRTINQIKQDVATTKEQLT